MRFGKKHKLLGLMDSIFGGAPSAGGSAPAPSPAAAPAPAASSSPAPAPAAAPATPSSPLDSFKNFWDNPVDAEGKPVAPAADPLATPVFTFDQTKITESAKALDFTKDINPELVARVSAGGADGTAALMELLNQVQQKAFVAATMNTGNMVNSALLKQGAAVKSSLPQSIRMTQLADLPVENQALSHPAAQPLVTTLRQVAASKNPNAAPAEIAKQVDDLLGGLMQAMMEATPQAVAKKTEAAKADVNWDSWMGLQ